MKGNFGKIQTTHDMQGIQEFNLTVGSHVNFAAGGFGGGQGPINSAVSPHSHPILLYITSRYAYM